MTKPEIKRTTDYFVDPKGEIVLLLEDDGYYRGDTDFDYGWLYQTPDMKYPRKRRTTAQTFSDRAMFSLNVAMGVLSPLVMWVAFLLAPGIAYALLAAAFTVVPVVIYRMIKEFNLFYFSWYGELRN